MRIIEIGHENSTLRLEDEDGVYNVAIHSIDYPMYKALLYQQTLLEMIAHNLGLIEKKPAPSEAWIVIHGRDK